MLFSKRSRKSGSRGKWTIRLINYFLCVRFYYLFLYYTNSNITVNIQKTISVYNSPLVMHVVSCIHWWRLMNGTWWHMSKLTHERHLMKFIIEIVLFYGHTPTKMKLNNFLKLFVHLYAFLFCAFFLFIIFISVNTFNTLCFFYGKFI